MLLGENTGLKYFSFSFSGCVHFAGVLNIQTFFIFIVSTFSVDETMAPLDPASKSQVMTKLKAFCQASVVLVIYHTDVGRGPAASDAIESSEDDEECVPSNSFFDHNLHVENKHLMMRPVC